MRALPITLVFLLSTSVWAGDADIDAAKAFVQTLQLAPTLQSGDVTIVPLTREGAPVAPKVVPLWQSKKTSFDEPEFPRRRYDVMVTNGGDTVNLHQGDNTLMDTVTYDDEFGWPGAADGDGPTKVMELSSHTWAKTGFSARKPYPGWIASTPAAFATSIIRSITR